MSSRGILKALLFAILLTFLPLNIESAKAAFDSNIGGGISFDGTDSSFLRFTNSQHLNFGDSSTVGNDYTISWWQYTTGPQVRSPRVFQFGEGLTNGTNFAVDADQDGLMHLYLTNGAQPFFNFKIKTPGDFKWNHIAIVKSGGTYIWFTNGLEMASYDATLTTGKTEFDPYDTSNLDFVLGGSHDIGGMGSFNGSILGLQIAKSARWTSNFTPPRNFLLPDAGLELSTYVDSNSKLSDKTLKSNNVAEYSTSHVSVDLNSTTTSEVTSSHISSNPGAVVTSGDGTKLFVLNHNSNSMTVYNSESKALLQTINFDSSRNVGPSNIAASSDGYIYVSCERQAPVVIGGRTIVSEIPAAVLKIRMSDGTLVNSSSNLNPNSYNGITVSPDGTKVYVVEAGTSGKLLELDSSSLLMLREVRIGNTPIQVIKSGDGSKFYVSNFQSKSISVIDKDSFAVTSTIALDFNPYALAPSFDGSIFAANDDDPGRVYKIRKTGTSTYSQGESVTVGSYPESIGLAPDGQTIYVTGNGDNSVSSIDLLTNSVSQRFTVGNSPSVIAISPDGRKIYITNSGDSSMSQIAVTSRSAAPEALNVPAPVATGKSYVAPAPEPITDSKNISNEVTVQPVPSTKPKVLRVLVNKPIITVAAERGNLLQLTLKPNQKNETKVTLSLQGSSAKLSRISSDVIAKNMAFSSKEIELAKEGSLKILVKVGSKQMIVKVRVSSK